MMMSVLKLDENAASILYIEYIIVMIKHEARKHFSFFQGKAQVMAWESASLLLASQSVRSFLFSSYFYCMLFHSVFNRSLASLSTFFTRGNTWMDFMETLNVFK